MIPWIQVYSNLIKHPKTTDLADKLNLTSKDTSPNVVAAGMLISLWLWAAQNATDGDLSNCPVRAIAEAAEYKKKPAAFVNALIEARWLDADMKLHDWDEYATLLIDCDEQQRQKTRERVQRHRARKKAACNDGVAPDCNAPGNVTDTPSNAPTKPYQTIPYLTNNYDGDADESARAREATENELARIGLRPGQYLGLTIGVVAEVEKITSDFVRRFAGRSSIPGDCRYVFTYACRWREEGYFVQKESVELLEYAFEQSVAAGLSGQWRYVIGIMDRLAARDIRTRVDAEAFDAERPDKEV